MIGKWSTVRYACKQMKPLKTPEELSKLIKETGRGRNLIFYEFDISKSPVLCTDKNGVLKSCTCLSHSVYANKALRETKCRFLLAYDIYNEKK